jgi:restriction system protein
MDKTLLDTEFQYIDTKEMPLEEWLTLLFNPPSGKQFTNWAFPTPEHRQEYLASIHQRPEDQVYRLLHKFLIPSTTMGCDKRHLAILKAIQKDTSEMSRRFSQYDKRLILYFSGHSPIPPWEGITWILDLLPHFPRQALEGLRAYILAHAQELPDGRYIGLYDASEVIRAKFIGIPGTKSEKIQFLLDLQPRDFECLVERLYHGIGYETMLTYAQKDGGRDIIATKRSPGKLEHLRIECKRYSGPIGVPIVRSLLGVVSDEKVNKGVLVTTSRFTEPAQKLANRNPRLELIAGNQLILLMNEYLGPSWPLHIDRLVVASQSQQTALVAKE